MRLALTTFLAFALTGCVAIQDLTNPLAAQGVILGVELPEDPELAAIAQLTGLVDQTIATVFLADGIQQRPITGAQISLAGNATAPFLHEGAGTYSIGPEEPYEYIVDEDVTVVVEQDGVEATMTTVLPPAAGMQMPRQMEYFQPVLLDFTGLEFDSTLIIVYDPTYGITWSNEPKNAQEALSAATRGEFVTEVEIPGLAFPRRSEYAVGIAGLSSNEPEDIDGMNTALSALRGGKLEWFRVSTLPTDLP